MNKKIVILTTNQSYTWTSVRELFPLLEKCWLETTKEVKLINLDQESLKFHLRFLISCDAYVILALNPKIAQALIYLRKNLGLSPPFIFPLLGLATVACWPFRNLNILDILKGHDIFIGTCDGDIKCMNKTFSNAKTYKIYYPYSPPDTSLDNRGKIFTYIGRLSDQKNIDLLLTAYHHLLQIFPAAPSLFIYGKEDHLGSPNMAIKSTDLLKNLQKLCQELSLSKKVFFKGFCSQEEIYKTLGFKHIFISASTHSDENFGISALNSLALGSSAVLSDWGGHKNFAVEFPKKVWTCPVFFLNHRPTIDPKHFSHMMLEALKSEENWQEKISSSNFLSQNITYQYQKILSQLSLSETPLLLTEIGKQVHAQKSNFEKQGNLQQIFYGYSDPLAHEYLSAYQ